MRLLKKFKEYNYYDDEVVYSDLYIFLEKIGGFISSAFYFLTKKVAQLFKAVLKLLKGEKNVKNTPKKEKSERFKAVLNKTADFFGRAVGNEKILKASAVIIFIVFLFSFVFGFAFKVEENAKNEVRFKNDAGAVCTKIISKYGITKTEKLVDENGEPINFYRITGLAYVREMDFNGDSSPELFICYEDGGVYSIEIWGYSRGEFIQYGSFEANSDKSDETLGSWASFYRRGSKIDIGVMNGEENEMELYSLSGTQFRPKEKCLYDAKNDLYYIDGERVSYEFETVRFSYLMPIRAQKTVEATAARLSEFGTPDIEEIEGTKTEEEKAAQAYYEIIQKYNQKYGKAEVKKDGELNYIDGLAAVRQLDFNNDGVKELMLVYRYGKKVAGEDESGNMLVRQVPTYYMEIYSWNGASAKLIYENDGLTTFQNNDENAVFYILKQSGGIISVCSNSYVFSENTTRVWKATSRISSMNNEGRFEPVFTAVIQCNYDYMKYWIDGERVYKKKVFEETAYQVPYFCNNDEFDETMFTVNVLQSENESAAKQLQEQVDLTVSEIKILNENYSA